MENGKIGENSFFKVLNYLCHLKTKLLAIMCKPSGWIIWAKQNSILMHIFRENLKNSIFLIKVSDGQKKMPKYGQFFISFFGLVFQGRCSINSAETCEVPKYSFHELTSKLK